MGRRAVPAEVLRVYTRDLPDAKARLDYRSQPPRGQLFVPSFDEALPAPDASGFHNFPIQARVDARLNAIPENATK